MNYVTRLADLLESLELLIAVDVADAMESPAERERLLEVSGLLADFSTLTATSRALILAEVER